MVLPDERWGVGKTRKMAAEKVALAENVFQTVAQAVNHMTDASDKVKRVVTKKKRHALKLFRRARPRPLPV